MADGKKKKQQNKSKSSKSKRTMTMKRKGVLNQRKTDNYATIEETHSVGLTAGNTYNVYHMLTDIVRGQGLAKEFQYYRIVDIKYRFKPLYDTFSTAYPSTIPQLYFAYDRSNTLPALSIPQFEQIGVKPIRFDDKIITKTLKPAVVGETMGNLPADYRISPWLPCNADPNAGFVVSTVPHYGTVVNITKMYAADATVYDVDITLTVQYKSPLVPAQGNNPRVNPPRGNVEFGGQTNNTNNSV